MKESRLYLWSAETMSIKIQLRFEEVGNPKLKKKLPDLDVSEFIRLFCGVRLKAHDEWHKTRRAIVDTGAMISIIPLDMWKTAETEILVDHEVYGINSRKECSISNFFRFS